ncbi:MAG: restriction endonuclease [Pyrinomonadaceae bacterium]
MRTIQQAVSEIKTLLEQAITVNGEAGKLSVIRSQKPIKLIHDAVQSELVANQAALTSIKAELTLYGLLKKKSQDIVVFPSNLSRQTEVISDGFLKGETDIYGRAFTERTLSINIRSQLSSLNKNFDTLYERTFAESLNFHLRCPNMCLGEVYMIPVYEYDVADAQRHIVSFSKSIGRIEKYLLAFNAINGRIAVNSDHHKYEQVCLLVVDFRQTPPKIYSSDVDLRTDGLLSQSSAASITNLTFQNFVPSLLQTYGSRFP